MKNIWIVIAAYNESAVIYDVIKNVRESYPNVVLVDDCSIDNTSAQATSAGAAVLRHPLNLGQGASLQTGINYALLRGANLIVTFDADGQHQVEDIRVLIDKQKSTSAEIVLGSRFLGRTLGMPLSRRLILKAAIFFTRITTGLSLTDAHNGFRLITREAALKLDIKQNRMAHASEIIGLISQLKLSLAEAPVTILYSEYSLSKGQKIFNSFNILVELIMGRISK